MRTAGWMGTYHLVLGFLGIGLLASPVPADTIDRKGKVTLTLTREPTEDEMVTLRVTAGVLPRNARVVVRTEDGEIAGTITPFGIRPGQKAGVHTIPVPSGALAKNKVELRFEVLEKDAKQARVATKAEIEDAKLVLIPAVRRPQKEDKP